MPRRALVVKLLLFTEVLSALLMVQLGQFTHVGFIAIPFFLTSLVAVHREHWALSIQFPDPRSVLLSVLSPKNYSSFGLRRGQKGIATFLATIGFVRILCLLPLAVTLRGECANPKCFFHRCDRRPKVWILVSAERGDRPPDCEWPASFFLHTGSRSTDKYNRGFHLSKEKSRIDNWCTRNGPTLQKVPNTMWASGNRSLLWPNSNVSGLCGEELNLVPAMARHTCMAGMWDPIMYQTCLHNAFFLPNMCNAKFVICGIFNGSLEGQASLVLTYMLIPSAALLVMVIIHVLVTMFGNFSTIQAQEDAQLR